MRRREPCCRILGAKVGDAVPGGGGVIPDELPEVEMAMCQKYQDATGIPHEEMPVPDAVFLMQLLTLALLRIEELTARVQDLEAPA